VREYRSCSESILKFNECFTGFLGKLEGNGFTSKMSKGNDNFGIVIDELSIEVHKPEERLNVLDSTGFGPILDDLGSLTFAQSMVNPSGERMNPR
jgi:hypothetical protein